MKSKLYAKVQRPGKRVSSWEEGRNSLPVGEWADAEYQIEMTQMKSKLYAEVQRPKKRAPSWKEEFSSLPECEWVFAESQRAMYQDKVKLVCRCAKPRKMGIFLRQKVELFTGGWVSWCWVPNDAENEKNNYNLKNLMYEKVFSFSTKTVLNGLTDL